MKYSKHPLSYSEQIKKLKKRGLNISNQTTAVNYLSNISYYRLRAYTYPFQNNRDENANHSFLRKDIHFEDIISLYCFDRRLRCLIFNAIEKIEIAFRTKVVYEYAMATNNSHWFLDEALFFEKDKYDKLLQDFNSEVARSNEDFVQHYKTKYNETQLPPAWMTLEVLSLGTLSRFYSSLKKSETKTSIAKSFGLPNPDFLVNWMHAISVLRNHCAHHSRIWNRRFTVISIRFPHNTSFPFMTKENFVNIRNNKLFAFISCIKYFLNIISPNSDFKKNLLQIIDEGGALLQLRDMGFPENWQNLDVWKEK